MARSLLVHGRWEAANLGGRLGLRHEALGREVARAAGGRVEKVGKVGGVVLRRRQAVGGWGSGRGSRGGGEGRGGTRGRGKEEQVGLGNDRRARVRQAL
eukprot:4756058-Pleurochrysis_carterae.AAC.1